MNDNQHANTADKRHGNYKQEIMINIVELCGNDKENQLERQEPWLSRMVHSQ